MLQNDDDVRFEKIGSVVLDKHLNLIWTKNDQGFFDYKDAQEHCSKLELDGHREWRLPTIDEWRSIIEGCPGSKSGGKCMVSDICVNRNKCYSFDCKCPELKGPGEYGCYWNDKVWGKECSGYWSDTKNPEFGAFGQSGLWIILFDRGSLGTTSLENRWYTKCVKAIQK